MAVQEGLRVVASEAAVEPDQQERGMGGAIGCQGEQGAVPVHIRRDGADTERMALGVDHQHPLAALHLLVRIVAAGAALRPGPHALRIDARRGRPPLATLGQPAAGDHDHQGAVEHRQLAPAAEPAPHRRPGREQAGQAAPGAAVAGQLPQGLQHDRRRPDPLPPELGLRVDRVDRLRQPCDHAAAHHILDRRRISASVLGRPRHLSSPWSDRQVGADGRRIQAECQTNQHFSFRSGSESLGNNTAGAYPVSSAAYNIW